jgi:RND superfamily putative drug exporter
MYTFDGSKNIAARMGRWSASHRKIAIFGWLAFVIVAFVIGMMAGTKTIDYETSGPGESGRADRILAEGFDPPASEIVLVESPKIGTDDPAFRAAIVSVVDTLAGNDAVTNVSSPLDPANAGQIAENGHAAFVGFDIRGDADDAGTKIDPILATMDELQKANPQVYIGQFGGTSANAAIQESFGKDLERAGLFSLPLTLAILIVAFGALVAAGIPLLLGLTAVLATLGLTAFTSQILPVDEAVSAIVLLIGLAVGVDYSLFYLRREREERAAGRSEEAALAAAAATSGRSVLISGFTVIVAMAGMLLAGDASFASLGIATMMVVAIAMVGSLTVLPAILSKLGDKVDRVRVPFVGRLRRGGSGRIWASIVGRVLRRPKLSVALAGGFLLALAVPAVQLHTAQPGPETFPQELPAVQTFNRLQQAFPGTEIPANVVVKAADVESPEIQAAIADLSKRALATGRMHEPIEVDVNEAGTVANIAIPVDGRGTDDASNAALAALRGELIPATLGTLPDVETAVTGMTASSKDGNDQLKSAAPFVFGFVLVFAFVLMLVAFRSIVIAAKAIVLNLLSVAAAYGVLVLVFQHGFAKGLLGFDVTSGIVPFLPIFLFVILFGLSMDYHVFILSRIRELYDRGATTDEAIAQGITSTAGVVTSAAIVMVGVFSIFGALSMIVFKQFGVGLAVAVLIDATIVRAVLLPAAMKLLGEANWYLPSWLEWLPRFDHGSAPAEPVEAPQAPALTPAA